MAPLTSVILGSLLVFLTHAEKHGVQVVSSLSVSLRTPLGTTSLCYPASKPPPMKLRPIFYDVHVTCKVALTTTYKSSLSYHIIPHIYDKLTHFIYTYIL